MDNLSFDEALRLYQEKNYNEAYNILIKLIETENLKAYTLLGLCYLNGYGCEESFDKAFECFSKAALNQEDHAYYFLGYTYEMGYGTIQNDIQAILWYKNSAKLGYPKSMLALGRLELKYDLEEGLKWLNEASKNHSISAMLILADYYKDLDKPKALSYLEEAAEAKNPKALYLLGKYYLSLDLNHEKALRALAEAASLGYDDALLFLAKTFMDPDSKLKNYKRGFYYLQKAFEKSVKGSDILLAKAYYYGLGTEVDLKAAKDILENSSLNNDSLAMLKLGDFYADNNPYKNLEIALYWWERGALLGNLEALIKASDCYQNKIGTAKVDLEKSYQYLSRAASLGSLEAKNKIKQYHKNIFGHYKLYRNRTNL